VLDLDTHEREAMLGVRHDGTPIESAISLPETDRRWAVSSGLGLAGVTFALSDLVSVPAVVLLSTAVSDPSGWYLLAAVSTLAGNATPIASAATLIVLDQASRRGVALSVVHLIRVGLPVAVVTSGLAIALLLV